MAVTSKLVFILAVIAVVVLSLLPAKQMPSLFPDRLQHLAAYALLGLLGGWAFPTRRSTILLVVGLSMLAIALEFAQKFAPGRSTEMADAMFSALGVCLSLVPKLFLRG
jgi:VanZ family protein